MKTPQIQTFARTIAVCSECQREVQQIEMPGNIKPCGHKAHISIVENPALQDPR